MTGGDIEDAAQSRRGRVEVDGFGIDAVVGLQADDEGPEDGGQGVGVVDGLDDAGGHPGGETASHAGVGFGPPDPQSGGHIGIAGGAQGELPFEEEQAAGLLRGIDDQVGGYGPESLRQTGGQLELGGDDGDEGLLPLVEEGQEESLFGAEVVVDGARGAAGGLGHQVDRDGVDAVVGEELGGGREQALPGVGLAL